MAEQTLFRISGNILVGCTQGLVGDEMLPEGIEIINEKRSFIVSRNEFTQAFPNFTTSGYGMTPEIAKTFQTVLRRCSGTTH